MLYCHFWLFNMQHSSVHSCYHPDSNLDSNPHNKVGWPGFNPAWKPQRKQYSWCVPCRMNVYLAQNREKQCIQDLLLVILAIHGCMVLHNTRVVIIFIHCVSLIPRIKMNVSCKRGLSVKGKWPEYVSVHFWTESVTNSWYFAGIITYCIYYVPVCTCRCVHIVNSTDSWTIHAFLNKTWVSLAPEYPLMLFKLNEWYMYCVLAAWCECYCLFLADSFYLSKGYSEKGTIFTDTSTISTSTASPATTAVPWCHPW